MALTTQKAASDAEAAVAFPDAHEPEPEPVAAPPVEVATWHLEVTCTRQQLDKIIAYLREQGITGRAVK